MNDNNNNQEELSNQDQHLMNIHRIIIQLQRENQVLAARIATLERNQLQLTRVIQTIIVLPEEPEEEVEQEETEAAQ